MTNVYTNVPALLSARGLAAAESLYAQSTYRLSTGLRVNTPGDDPAGFAISTRLRSRIYALESAEVNVQDGLSLAQTASEGVEAIIGLLQEMRTFAIQSLSGTATTADRNANNVQFQDLVQEINRIASTTEFNGKVLLNGSYAVGTATITLQLGPESGSWTALNIADLKATALGVADETVTDDDPVAAQTAASAAIIAVDDALDTVTEEAGKVGGKMTRLEHAADFLESQQAALAIGVSGHLDADVAAETINFTRASILRDMSASMLAQTRAFPSNTIRIILGIASS